MGNGWPLEHWRKNFGRIYFKVTFENGNLKFLKLALNLQEIPMNLEKLTKMLEKIFESKKQAEWIEIFKSKKE
jgi:hypothetical protein